MAEHNHTYQPGPSASKKLAIAERRSQVADMLMRRVPHARMAEILEVHPSTITRDVKAILKTWDKELEGKAGRLRARDAYVLDHLEMNAQANYENAVRRRQEIEERDGGIQKSGTWERFDRSARGWLEERLKIQKRRAELLNLDRQQQQTQVAVQVPISFIRVNPLPPKDEPPALIEGEIVDHGHRD